MKLAVVGVTGMVGQEILKVLKESDIKIDEFIPVASERSNGKNRRVPNNIYRETFRCGIYFPIQKVEKISPNRSSGVSVPTISPKV